MKTVVVTGGTVRLGRAIAEGLRQAGWRVITTSHRAEAGADIVADLADPMGAARLYAAALALNGGFPPDALVNNAALYGGEEEKVYRIGAEAPKKLTMLMAGRETGIGCVVNVLDGKLEGFEKLKGDAGCAAYARAKCDLRDWTRQAALMFVDTLRVNAVSPGPVLAPVDRHEKASPTPLGRPTPEAVAQAVAWLCAAPFTTGCIVPVDGGASQAEAVG